MSAHAQAVEGQSGWHKELSGGLSGRDSAAERHALSIGGSGKKVKNSTE